MARSIFLGIFICIPALVHADVVLSEIAWMGTAEDANNEWIELFNDGSGSASLDGWTLSDGVSLSIPLSGFLSAGSYALLERTDDTTVPSEPAFLVYTGALGNDGRTLTLTDESGTVVDQAVGGENWENIGGSNETKETAQRTESGWITGTPTPGRENLEETEITEDTEETEASSARTTSRGGGSGRSVQKAEPMDVAEPELTLAIEGPSLAYVNQRVTFMALPEGLGPTLTNSLVYLWNFGDAYTGEGKEPSHLFEYPGDYVVVVEAQFARQHEIARHEIKVLPVSITLSRTPEGDIRLKNNSAKEMDLGGFTLGGAVPFIFPRLTLLKPGGELTISRERMQAPAPFLALRDAEHTLVASLGTVDTPFFSVPKLAVAAPAYASLSAATDIQATSQEKLPLDPGTSSTATATPRTEETVIRIGNDAPSEEGFFSGFFKKLAHLFGD